MKSTIFAVLASVSTISPAATQPVDNYATVPLSAAKYEQVVAKLEPFVTIDRRDETLLLNLAMAYRHTGRGAEADMLYRRVLMLENVELNTAKRGAVWSHDVASKALAAHPMVVAQQ